MDGTAAAVRQVGRAHLRHGTTTLYPTTTESVEQVLAMLEACRAVREESWEQGGARIEGAHLYGPFFAEDKVGCHSKSGRRSPGVEEYRRYFSTGMVRIATCAAELAGAEAFYREALRRGCFITCGHSNSSWGEMAAAFKAGMRHVDHFWCAMSNVSSLRERLGAPMRGSMLEFVLAEPEMSTEVIADGCHLAQELLDFAFRMKGAARLCLVTDCNRALDRPPGRFRFGPETDGSWFESDGKVGWASPDSLASSIRGMDHMVRQMKRSARGSQRKRAAWRWVNGRSFWSSTAVWKCPKCWFLGTCRGQSGISPPLESCGRTAWGPLLGDRSGPLGLPLRPLPRGRRGSRRDLGHPLQNEDHRGGQRQDRQPTEGRQPSEGCPQGERSEATSTPAGWRRCIAAASSPSPTPPRSRRAASRSCCASAASSFASAPPFATASMCCSATQRHLEMPQVSDLFGKKGMAALRKLRFDQPHRQLILQQDLDLLRELGARVKEDEKAVAPAFDGGEDYGLIRSVPGIGAVLGAVIATEIDGIGRFSSAKKLLGYAGLSPTTSSSGGKTCHGRMIRACNHWLKWAFVEAAWVSVGCDAYFGGLYRAARARGKGANTAITIVASRMATIVFHLLKEHREFTPFPPNASKPPAAL